jgi:putative DNA methylase
MSEPKKLIEVAMPIKEISAASVHDKYIHHGHISTLHIWWARRPLPVCRAVTFASLVPDPLDKNCPIQFREAVDKLLGKKDGTLLDVYKPYDDIPFTSAIDKMEDNSRNRLLMFIGKFSEEFLINEKTGKSTSVGKQMSDFSLIKWENRTNESILNIARKLIWVSYNCKSNNTLTELLDEFDTLYSAIKKCEAELYAIPNRHLDTDEVTDKTINLSSAIKSFQSKMPIVFDPFAGGGAIPLEMSRLGCRSYGNDINPVAHIIQKGSLEFPQKYGKPINYSKAEFELLYGVDNFIKLPNEIKEFDKGDCIGVNIINRLSYDVEHYAKKILHLAEEEIGHLYPSDNNGKKPLVYYWTRLAECSNPTCKAMVPLLKQFYLANKKDKQIYLNPIISKNEISFEIKKGKCDLTGWNNRGNLTCPCCGSVTDVKKIKEQIISNKINEKLLVVVQEGVNGKEYRLPTASEEKSLTSLPINIDIPNEKMQRNSAGGDTFSWGIDTWGQLYSKRQLLALQTLINKLHIVSNELAANENDYYRAVVTYLGIWIDRIAAYLTSFGRWIPQNEQLTSIFGRQAIAMVFDYPEVSIFAPSTSGPLNQLEWITMYINSESSNPFISICNNATSGEKEQFNEKSITAVITDPPYYDAIAYADLSDFFYVWLKRTISGLYPINFATPQTPKTDECTMLKHHHNGDAAIAKQHFENKLLQIFDSIEHQTSDIVSIMFAHQSTEAWTTLCNSILGARMNITGSWAIDSERDTRMIANAGSALQSSVTVSCIPSIKSGIGEYKKVRADVVAKVSIEVEKLYNLGFRGADLLTACFGQAVSEFGKYQTVEKADGSLVTVPDLLELARESAFNALLKGFDGDDFTKFYIGWLQLNGFVDTDFDDAAKFTKVGLTINVQDLFKEHILIKSGNKQHLGNLKDRLSLNSKLGESRNSTIIDVSHRLMALYGSNNRASLLKFIKQNSCEPENSVWRVLTSLAELLPKEIEDHKLAVGLLLNKDQLIREAKSSNTPKPEQSQLTFE